MSLVIVSLPATAPSDDAENRYLSLLFYNFNFTEFDTIRDL